jgi:GAF domain-containing protein
MIDRTHDLLQAVTDAALVAFDGIASSVLAVHQSEFEFRAAGGRNASAILGRRFPTGVGLAGYAASTRQVIFANDLATDHRFARAYAKELGYVPTRMLVVPLLDGGRVVGVCEVLDRTTQHPFTLRDAELLAVIARPAAIALSAARS